MNVKVERTGSLFSASAIEAIMNEEVKVYLTDASKRLERAVAEKIPVNQGTTRGALFSGLRGITQGRGESFVSLPVEHAEALEMGSKPHWPPYDPTSKTFPQIYLWVTQKFRDKGGSIRVAVKEARRKGSRATFGDRQDRAIRGLTFLIARKMSKTRSKAYRMFARSKADLEPDLKEVRWLATLERIAKRLSA